MDEVLVHMGALVARVNIGKVFHSEKKKRVFYCTRGFPEDCSEYRCTKMMLIDKE